MKLSHKNFSGFTIIELVVVIAIISILSGLILFSVTQYINRGKDSNISGNLAILIPAGEAFYNSNGNSYKSDSASVCDPKTNSVLKNAISQWENQSGDCYAQPNDSTQWKATGNGIGKGNPAGICCNSTEDAWAACAREFTNPDLAYCVDSKGEKHEICDSSCEAFSNGATVCPEAATASSCAQH